MRVATTYQVATVHVGTWVVYTRCLCISWVVLHARVVSYVVGGEWWLWVIGDVTAWVKLEGGILSGQLEAANSLQADLWQLDGLQADLRQLDPGGVCAAGHVRRHERDEVSVKAAAEHVRSLQRRLVYRVNGL